MLIADATVRLSRGRFEHTMTLVGERILRGFETPVDVYELVAGARVRLAAHRAGPRRKRTNGGAGGRVGRSRVVADGGRWGHIIDVVDRR